jgi:hypothetical protein
VGGADRRKSFHYRLRGPAGFAHELKVVIDGATLECIEPAPATRPWTELGCHQCPNCPLDRSVEPLCPFAARIEPVVVPLGALLSHDRVEIEADCGDRRVVGATSAQAAASSLIGLIGATSGCPLTAFLKPMAWFHLPLATEEETVFRAAASYLLGQYFAFEQGRQPDWELAGLKHQYEELHTVNIAMAARLRQAVERDASVNAIVCLDLFAKAVPWSIEDFFDSLRWLFAGKRD